MLGRPARAVATFRVQLSRDVALASVPWRAQVPSPSQFGKGKTMNPANKLHASCGFHALTLRLIVALSACLALVLVPLIGYAQSTLYVVNLNYPVSNISVVDTRTADCPVVSTISGYGGPLGLIAYDSTNNLIWLPSGEAPSGRVYLIDPNTDQYVGSGLLGGNLALPNFAAISPQFQRAYISLYYGGGVAVFDLLSKQYVTTIATGYLPNGIAFDVPLRKVYVVNNGSASVSVINADNNTVVNTIYGMGSQPAGVGIDELAHKAVVAKSGAQQLALIDTVNDVVVSTLSLSGYPQWVAVDSGKHRAYVSVVSPAQLVVVNTVTNAIVNTISLGSSPTRLAASPTDNRLYVTDRATNSVYVLDTTTDAVQMINQFTVGNDPVDIALAPAKSSPPQYCGPVVGAMSIIPNLLPVNSSVTASATFNDSNLNDSFAASWSWGDGASSPGNVSVSGGSGTITGTHTYTTPGVYTVRVTVTDGSGANGESLFQYIVVYDPAGGFVTGGGWFTSPPGAYAPKPELSDKATFGFVSKYAKGANVPTGSTEFNFKVANFAFKSTNYEWLVVAGARATYKGVGTINGLGAYSFILNAIDGDLLGTKLADRLRIKIWSGGEGVVYDNMRGEGDGVDPIQGIEGGSIVIHK